MKVLKTVPQTIVQREVVSDTICDICGKSVDKCSGNMNEVNVNAKIGDSWPECDCREAYLIDVCSDCFLNKIKPLIEQTYDIQFREYNSDELCENHEYF